MLFTGKNMVGDSRQRPDLLTTLRLAVGKRNVIVGKRQTRRFSTGYRTGKGDVLAVVRPGTLVEQWRVVKACINANVIVIMQASNTGLTGGSTPRDQGYDRPVVLVSTTRIKGIHIINEGRQAVCLAGATLYELERKLSNVGRQPHSVIGSSCIGASVVGGVCNNSGGALVQRGPAYTELSLYAQADETGELRLVNHMGIDLGDDPETILDRLERQDYTENDISYTPDKRASACDYGDNVRLVDDPTPARFNADPTRLYEAAGSAGRLIVFAVRLDSFPLDDDCSTFYVGTNDPKHLTAMRRHMLTDFEHLPISAEYIHRDAFDIAAVYGKDTFFAIDRLGTDWLPQLFAFKARLDSFASRFGALSGFSDRLLQMASRLLPNLLPPRLREFRNRFEHHLILKVSASGAEETRAYFSASSPDSAGVFECSPLEARRAFLHRFAVAGAAVRYRLIHADTVEDIVAIDVALPRNTLDWFEELPVEIDQHILHKIYYGHFFCHVFHQDYVVARGVNPHALEDQILATIDRRGGEYPAEHNVGHLYSAKPALAQFYRDLDPGNHFNPGIGHTPAEFCWQKGQGERVADDRYLHISQKRS